MPLKFLREFAAAAAPRLRFPLLLIVLGTLPLMAQDSYEIQVYPYDTVEPGSTMVELHSNFTAKGTKTVVDGVESRCARDARDHARLHRLV